MIYPECDKCQGHDFKVTRVPLYQREYMLASRFVKEATGPHAEIGLLLDHYCNMTCTACGAVYRFVLRSGPPPRYSQLPVEFIEDTDTPTDATKDRPAN